MKSLGTKKFYCQLSKNEDDRYSNQEIRTRKGKLIHSYSDLVEELAKVAYYNPGYSFFYRGQKGDYSTIRNSTSIYPTLFRCPGRKLSASELNERYNKLELATQKIIAAFKQKKFSSYKRMEKFPELAWSVLQHYEVCRTPLTDVTHSARVASSFALPKNKKNNSGYFYVFALPHPNEGVGYSFDNELVMLKLLSVCPPEAKRPFYQEGYLVGNFPHHVNRKRPSYDLAVRLIAKFELKGDSFWNKEFPAIPQTSLSPVDDKVKDICSVIEEELSKVKY